MSFMSFHFDGLSVKANYEQKKTQVLIGILEAFKTFKKYNEYVGDDIDLAKKVVKRAIKKRLLTDENIYHRLKKLILLRERDRSTRENAVKIMKKIIKFTKKACKIMLEAKIEVFVSFILEREYRHAQLLKERM